MAIPSAADPATGPGGRAFPATPANGTAAVRLEGVEKRFGEVVAVAGIRTALLAGGLLAFALSFDEVIVTTFTTGGDQTLPIYILKLLSRDPSPAVNVVAIVVILLSAVPVYLATRLSSDTGVAGGRT